MAGLPLRFPTLPRWKTNPKGLHTMYAGLSRVKVRCALTLACQKTNPKGLHSMYAGLSRVKPRCVLTLACQKTNPKGLWSLVVVSGSNYVLTIILSMRTWFDLLIIPNKSHILQPIKHSIKPHNYNTIASDVNTHLPPPTTSASNNSPQNRFTRHAIPPPTPSASSNPNGVSLLAGQC